MYQREVLSRDIVTSYGIILNIRNILSLVLCFAFFFFFFKLESVWGGGVLTMPTCNPEPDPDLGVSVFFLSSLSLFFYYFGRLFGMSGS